MIRALFVLTLSIIFAGDSSAFGQSNAPLPLFAGYVTSTDGEVIEGAKVFVTWTNSEYDIERDPSIPPSDQILGSAISGPDGSYKVQWNLRTKPNRRETETRFHLTVLHPKWVPLQGSFSLNDSGDIRATIQLSEGVAYKSRVVDKEGKPVAGAKVRLEGCYKNSESTKFVLKMDRTIHLFMDLSETLIATTNEQGEFNFPCLPKSQCVLLRVQHSDYPSVLRLRTTTSEVPQVPSWLTDCRPEIREWWDDMNDDIHLGTRGRLQITVREQTSKRPVPGVVVAPYYSGISAMSNEDGQLELPVHLRETMNFAYVRKTGTEQWIRSSIYKEGENFVVSTFESASLVRIQGTVFEAGPRNVMPGVPVVCNQNHEYTTTDLNGKFEFNIPRSLTDEAFVKLEGPLEGWWLPFKKFIRDLEDLQIPFDPSRHQRFFKLDSDVSGIEFEVGKIPVTTILVLGLDGKPAPDVKVALTSNSGWNMKPIETGWEGKIRIPLLLPYSYLFYAQGPKSEAAITWVELLPTEGPITIQLLPSVEVNGSAWLEDYTQEVFPAEGAIIGIPFRGEVAKAFQIGEEDLHLHVARVDSNGKYSFRLPQSEAPIENWEIISSGTRLKFRDHIFLNKDAQLIDQILRPVFSNPP